MNTNNSPILNELRPLFPAYLALIAIGFFTTFLVLVPPLFAEQVSDRVLTSRSASTLLVLAFIATFLVGIGGTLDVIRGRALARIGADIDGRLSRRLFDALHRASPTAGKSVSVNSLQDFNTVRDFLSGPGILSFLDVVWSPVYIIVMALVDWVFVALFLAVLLIYIALAILNGRVARHQFAQHQAATQVATEFGAAIARNSDSVRALGMISRLQARWYDLHTDMLGWRNSATDRVRFIAGAMRFMHRWQMILVFTMGGLLYIYQDMPLSGLLVLTYGINRGIGPILSVVTNWASYSSFVAAKERLDDILIKSENRQPKLYVPTVSGTLDVSRVFVSAPGEERIILNDINFSLPQGRILGIVGPNGAGKSCLVRTIVGVWKPRRGSISIGDHDISHIDEDNLGANLGYLAQEVELLPGSVAENIARFAPDDEISSEKIIAAAELVGIQDLIRGLPNGYNTLVGPSGYILSGGQRHRVALARAVYGDPSLIVLDEPNANLDAQGEQALAAMLQKLQSMGASVIVVTHKLNLLNYCDDILVLNAGTVQAFGSRDLISRKMPRLRATPSLAVIEGTSEGRRH